MSGGRVVWNAVTSFNPDVAANFGRDALPDHRGTPSSPRQAVPGRASTSPAGTPT
ncbi:hypothetical protein [Rhodococcus sp. NCIMB 12038]|uniref:hypothetical protein n=1 Tax=Rhodococcus sp. NCIMB 12038 TaxID=933800 RepID=UPI000B3C1DF1|nr:hypothetical protein CA951_31785 [Rhodococcus sp. NCIMB 12038]